MSIIAYQGIPGSFSHTAAQDYFGKDTPSADEFIGTNQFKEIFELVKNEKADFGIVPVENSLAGSIYENYDLLAKYKIQVIGEQYLKIEHCLLGIDMDIKNIKEVYSHPKALEQCLKFFESHEKINKNIFSDTARAAKFVADKKDVSLGAIASYSAAKLYKLKVIKKNIEDNPDNFTRFLVISNNELKNENADKCSLIFKVPHIPGSLYKALQYIAYKGMNLTKIESRPIHGLPFEYLFYVDVEFNKANINIQNTLNEFKSKVIGLIILGIYKARLNSLLKSCTNSTEKT